MIVQRDNIGIFGKVNSGKSSLMNLLTQQECSIVDPKPGTTADTKITVQEVHGIGPVKLFDTAGIDEQGLLGDKKRKKAFNDLKESDLILLIIDPATNNLESERLIIEKTKEYNKQLLVIYNLFKDEYRDKIKSIEKELDELRFFKKITLRATDKSHRQQLLNFILNNFESKNHKIDLLPFIEKDEYYILNIPMDEETPPGRYLRPQQLVEEYITRHWAYPVSYRMDLKKARSNDSKEAEKERFLNFLNNSKKKPKAIITDSQAIDVMGKWVPEDIELTTFSIVMINYVTKGRLKLFAEGIKAMDAIKDGDKILIAEACNHSRIAEDIGTVQIPNYIKKHYPNVIIEHSFGREFKDNKDIEKYKLIIHCGGCMIDSQKLNSRLHDLEAIGIPLTNYGIFLAYLQGKETLKRVLKPWRIDL